MIDEAPLRILEQVPQRQYGYLQIKEPPLLQRLI